MPGEVQSRQDVDRVDDGPAVGTCSPHCAVVDLGLTIDKTPKALMVGDLSAKKLVGAEKAMWVIGGKKVHS